MYSKKSFREIEKEKENEIKEFLFEKRILDSEIRKKKSLLAGLYDDLQMHSKTTQLDPLLLADFQIIQESEVVQKMIAEITLLKESDAKNYEDFQVIKAQKKIRKLAMDQPTLNVANTIFAINDLTREIQRLSDQHVSHKQIIRELAVNLPARKRLPRPNGKTSFQRKSGVH